MSRFASCNSDLAHIDRRGAISTVIPFPPTNQPRFVAFWTTKSIIPVIFQKKIDNKY